MKKIILFFLILFTLLSLALFLSGCIAGDLNEPTYFQDIYPNANNSGSIGLNTSYWNSLWVTNINGVPYSPSGGGTVTSVGLSLPAEFTISGSPVTGAGTLSGAWSSQNQNLVFASPNGLAGTPSFRSLASGDIPDISGTYVTNLALSTWVGTSNITTLGTITSGTWHGGLFSPVYGGTGVANGANNTITFTGNYTLGITLTNNTSVTFPTSGTLATTTDLGNYVPYSGATGAVDLNNQNLTNVGTASFNSTVTLANNTYINFRKADTTIDTSAGMYLSAGNNLSIKSGGGELYFNNALAKDIHFWGGTAGTGRVFEFSSNDSSVGSPLQDSPSLKLRSRYWSDGSVNTTWDYSILNDMTASGATPASTVSHKINSVSVIDLVNTNGTVTGALYGKWGIGTKYLTTGYTLTALNEPVNPSTSSGCLIFYVSPSETVASNANQLTGAYGGVNWKSTNTQNWTGAIRGVIGVLSSSSTATGIITAASNFDTYTDIQGMTLTTWRGLIVRNPSASSNIGTAYGIYIESITRGGTANYALYSAGGLNYFAGNTGIGISPTSYLTLKAGTATAGTAPLKLTSGTLLTNPEVGAIEFLTDTLYYTSTTGTSRQGIPGVTFDTAAPATTPIRIGDIFVDTTNHKVYISDGTTNSTNWIILN